MDFETAMKRCILLAKAKVNDNCAPEVDATLFLRMDPTTEEGAKVIEFLNKFGIAAD
jgi:hypothetical protein